MNTKVSKMKAAKAARAIEIVAVKKIGNLDKADFVMLSHLSMADRFKALLAGLDHETKTEYEQTSEKWLYVLDLFDQFSINSSVGDLITDKRVAQVERKLDAIK